MPTPRPPTRSRLALAALAALALVLAACRDSGSTSASGDGTPTTTTAPAGQPPAATEVLEIGLAVPLSGPEATTAAGLRDAAELAVRHANTDGRVPGVTLRLVTVNTGTADDGVQKAIARLARRERVVAVIAALSSSAPDVLDAVRKTLADDDLALLSPSDTDPALTRGSAAPPDTTAPDTSVPDTSVPDTSAPDTSAPDSTVTTTTTGGPTTTTGGPTTTTGVGTAPPLRPIPSLFRLSADDLDVAPFAADYVRRDLATTAVALVGDATGDPFGALDAFAARFGAAGGSVATRLVFSSPEDVPGVVDAVRASGASAVVLRAETGLTTGVASALVPVPPAPGWSLIALGPEGCAPGSATSLPDGVLCVAPVAPAGALASARAFAEDYEAAGFAQPAGTAGPLAYDAVTVVVDALSRTVTGGVPRTGLRAGVTAAIGAGQVQGATGTLAFDAQGDAVAPVLTVLRAEAGGWVAVVSRAAS